MSEALIKKEIHDIENKLNDLCKENNLLLDIDTFKTGSIGNGNWSIIKIRVYKEI